MTALKEALAARSVRLERLIASGLSERRIAELLSDADPTVDEVRLLSKHLHIPVRELLVSPPSDARSLQKYRSNFGRSPADELEYEGALGSYRAKLVARLVDVSDLPFFSDFPKTLASAEQLARMFRENILGIDRRSALFGLSETLFAKFGVVQLVSKFRSLDGVATRTNGTAIVLLAERHLGRMRFTLCHEVCHLITDLPVGSDEIWLDQEVTHETAGSSFEEESFANAFAAACLLPPGGVSDVVRRWRATHDSPADGLTALEVMNVARSFGTSFDVAGGRLEVLELLPAGATRSLRRAITEEFASPEKFGDHFGLAADPGEEWNSVARGAMRGCAEQIRAGEISVERAAEIFGLSLQEALEVVDASRYH
ncbi:hypothetical protein ASC89_19320 [Devosia sp. Root413D1]|uniref:ImmA/IrrE family metallo-endopeptidase n=1 Tax=Devosia sp. Root413D1 TaxID=1736531 RepID=UPI0006FD6874|nr:ImmA/IrrE family metallo-endopeptidase [Devosia sp. Root413D1]KQW77341.1 hypothetical protein ASC89_19320 [Devosia sp. Root413D1]